MTLHARDLGSGSIACIGSCRISTTGSHTVSLDTLTGSADCAPSPCLNAADDILLVAVLVHEDLDLGFRFPL